MPKKATSRPSITIVGPGNLGSALAIELFRTGYPVSAIVRRSTSNITRPKALARRVKADWMAIGERRLDSDIIWLTVPDDAIAEVAARLAASQSWKGKIVFHSSGAHTSEELLPLKKKGASIASVHPMMTFVRGRRPKWRGVSFAIEGDAKAVRCARIIAEALGGKPFQIEKHNKALYHAFGAFASPLVIALMSAMEQVAAAAGIPSHKAKPMMRPLLMQTLENYFERHAAGAFSGPLVRGDVHTVRKHLAELKRTPHAREAYVALARVAIAHLPVRNKEALQKELGRGKRTTTP